MKVRQKESVKAVTPKDKLRQNTNAGLGRLDTTALGTKTDIAVNTANSGLRSNASAGTMNQQTAEMQRKQGQYHIAKKQYTIKRNNSNILRSKQAAEQTANAKNAASAKNAANAGQHSNDYQEGKNKIDSTDSTRRMSIGSANGTDKWERTNNSINQPCHAESTQLHHAGNASGLTNYTNILLLKKAAADLQTQKKTKMTQNNSRKSGESANQENESGNPQMPQRNIFDAANEEGIDKICHHGQRTAHQMAAQMKHHYRHYAQQEQGLTKTAAKQHSQQAAQEQFKRTRNAQSLREKQDMRQMTARQAQISNRSYADKPINAMEQTQNPENRQSRTLRGKSHLRDPTENAMIDSNLLNTGRYIAKLRSNKIASASHSAMNFETAADSHAAQRRTAEQIQQKRKSTAIRNLLKKRINKKAAVAQYSAPSASGYSISGRGSILSLTAEHRIIQIAQTAGRTIKSLLLPLVSAGTTIILRSGFFCCLCCAFVFTFWYFLLRTGCRQSDTCCGSCGYY